MDEILSTIASSEEMIMGLAIGPLVLFTGLLIVRMCCRAAMENTRQREETRREVAAYVAEGSMSGEEAERLMQPRPWYADSFCVKKAKDAYNDVAASVNSGKNV